MEHKIKKVLITGATGHLGAGLVASGFFPGALTPSRREMDICNAASVRRYFQGHTIDAVIHAAAMARMHDCQRDPAKALQTNLMGTARLVEGALSKEKKLKKSIRFVYISTDGVYPSTRGQYKETDAAIPYNEYGWTKLGAECAVNLLKNHCIIRTRFFDPNRIGFKTYTRDAYNSGVPLEELVRAVHQLLQSDFIGTVNVGGRRDSDYNRYKSIKPSIKPCLLKDVQKKTPIALSRDASLNCSLWRTLRLQ
ncbi:MAG: sugar nucleotide-binding protein [Candidatus Omnitrophica bacterium]|nr:sugar nucleotide-binding protein [Candidatus Omnitrophota bacterium]MDE2221659.1 sugar nucleotide-binding protein [Candidatus Omnitrophota bacterium]